MSVSSRDAPPLPPPPKPDDVESASTPSSTNFTAFVLGFDDEASEAAFYEDLVAQAVAAGIALPPPIATPQPPPIPSPPPSITATGRPASTESRTSVTSSPQLTPDLSATWDRSPIAPLFLHSSNRTSSLNSASGSTRSRDSVLSQAFQYTGPSSSQHVRKTSLPSVEPISIPLSFGGSSRPTSPRKQLIRGLSRLRIRRQDSDRTKSCPNCSSANHTVQFQLPCGHSHCNTTIRELVDTATTSVPGARPSCCGRPIPRTVLDAAFENGNRHSNPDITSEPGEIAEPNRASSSHTNAEVEDFAEVETDVDEGSSTKSTGSASAKTNLAVALSIPDFHELRTRQSSQRDRFLEWDLEHRTGLKVLSTRRKREADQDLEKQQEALMQKHAATLADVEDKHILAEADLRSVQATEQRNVDTALRHMTAFCRGKSVNGETHNRPISDQNYQELAKTQRMRDTMEARHQNAVNVLRGEQTVRINARLRRNEAELDRLQRHHDRDVEQLQQDLNSAMDEWSQTIAYQKAVLERWWLIESQLCLSKFGHAVELSADAPLPPIPWIKTQPVRPETPPGRTGSVTGE